MAGKDRLRGEVRSGVFETTIVLLVDPRWDNDPQSPRKTECLHSCVLGIVDGTSAVETGKESSIGVDRLTECTTTLQ